ncbi:enoyl-CoA hydratase-related protein [soil metagenome]
MATESDAVTYVVTNSIATITLNRPDGMNSLTLDMKELLKAALHRAETDAEARVVVLTGSGRAFCVGQDLREHIAGLTSENPGPLSDTVSEHYNPIVTAIATMPKPVIAAVNGIAAGAGASLAFAADFRVMVTTAGFNTAFAGIALSCDTGASWTLPRLVGRQKATELLMFPRTIEAKEALKIGLANYVLDPKDFPIKVGLLAEELAAGPTLAYASMKRAMNFAESHDLAESLAFEGSKMALTGASADHLVAVKAFLAKEKPVFTGS